MGLIMAIIAGGIVGFLAHVFMKSTFTFGPAVQVVVGMAGALAGGFAVRTLTEQAHEDFWGWLIALASAAAAIAMMQWVGTPPATAAMRRAKR